MLRKFIVFLALAGISNTFAQNAGVEKSTFDIQTGLLGIWANNETRLAHSFALRSEIGLDLGVADGANYSHTIYVLLPIIALEPRYYYNFAKREAKGKNTKSNSANFFTIMMRCAPDWFVVANDNVVHNINELAVVPKWGIRRVYGKHLSFETGIGIGPVFYFGENANNYDNPSDVYLDLHLRVGYHF